MDDDPKEKLDLAATATEASEIETRQVYLRDGRTLTVSGQGSQELVEIHASSGCSSCGSS
jgi:Fe-S cluster biogenesis protein NfuA